MIPTAQHGPLSVNSFMYHYGPGCCYFQGQPSPSVALHLLSELYSWMGRQTGSWARKQRENQLRGEKQRTGREKKLREWERYPGIASN